MPSWVSLEHGKKHIEERAGDNFLIGSPFATTGIILAEWDFNFLNKNSIGITGKSGCLK